MQLSDKPYADFLRKMCGSDLAASWWGTELHGWQGGTSYSARKVDITRRLTYIQGFAPVSDIPHEAAIIPGRSLTVNAVGLVKLGSWADYYELRDIPLDSPVALLLTFPLTLYHAIVQYGMVCCVVARMLQRRIRVHIVGAEKELNMLDVYKEVMFLMRCSPNMADATQRTEWKIELVFVVRPDMMPHEHEHMDKYDFSLCDEGNLHIYVVAGTYNESIDPRFDCGTGMPDMVVAYNAGLFAYKSWRSVVRYLDQNAGVVGVFTDYNEHSAVNCASLGGHKARESVRVNAFRQPRAMPVYSMNLPQYSNGFVYVYNEQELDE